MIALVLLGLVLPLAQPATAPTVAALDAHHEPLRARFDADAAASPRLLLLLSPT